MPTQESKKIAEMSSQVQSKPLVVESVAVVTTVTEAPPRSDRWLVRSCCCGCSLATGVWLIACMEAVSWFTGIVAGIFALVLESQKKQIDSAIENADSEDASAETSTGGAGEAPEDSMTTEEKVSQTNAAIDAFAIASPFVLAMALVGLYFACKGISASRGNVAACHSYLRWRKVCVVYAAFAMVLGMNGGPVSGFLSLLLAVYYAVVVKSHGVALEQQGANSETFVAVAGAV